MGHRGDPVEEFRSEVGIEFAFLVEDAGFSGAEQIDNGLVFHGAGLDVEVWFLDGHEPEVTTLVASDGVRSRGHGWTTCMSPADAVPLKTFPARPRPGEPR